MLRKTQGTREYGSTLRKFHLSGIPLIDIQLYLILRSNSSYNFIYFILRSNSSYNFIYFILRSNSSYNFIYFILRSNSYTYYGCKYGEVETIESVKKMFREWRLKGTVWVENVFCYLFVYLFFYYLFIYWFIEQILFIGIYSIIVI